MGGSSIPDLAEWQLFQQGRDDVIGKEVVITRVRNRRRSVSLSGAPRGPQLLLPRRHGCCCCSACACSSSSLLWTLAPRDRFPPREVAFYLLQQSLRPPKRKTRGKLFSYSSPFIALLFALCSFVRLALSLSPFVCVWRPSFLYSSNSAGGILLFPSFRFGSHRIEKTSALRQAQMAFL